MTDFFMRYCKKIKAILLSFTLILACVAWAGDNKLAIKSAELSTTSDDFYRLDAEFEIRFHPVLEEAINKGIPLHFLVEFQIVSPRKYWFDDEIETATQTIILSYHALTRQYLVTQGNHQKSFATLAEAKDGICHLSDWKVLRKSQIEEGETYHAALLMRLDQNKLPKQLQIDAIASEEWALTSQKFQWKPELSKSEPNK